MPKCTWVRDSKGRRSFRNSVWTWLYWLDVGLGNPLKYAPTTSVDHFHHPVARAFRFVAWLNPRSQVILDGTLGSGLQRVDLAVSGASQCDLERGGEAARSTRCRSELSVSRSYYHDHTHNTRYPPSCPKRHQMPFPWDPRLHYVCVRKTDRRNAIVMEIFAVTYQYHQRDKTWIRVPEVVKSIIILTSSKVFQICIILTCMS